MSWLSGSTIIQKIKKNADAKTLDAFKGIHPIDKLPAFISSYPFIIIVNTHTHNLNGEHWIAIFIDKNKNGELFDSLALPVSNHIIRWMNKFTRKWLTNGTAYQYSMSTSCGAFVLFYVLKRLFFKDFLSLKKEFALQPYANERIVLNYFRNLK